MREILERIFINLDLKSLVACENVCDNWYQVLKCSAFWLKKGTRSSVISEESNKIWRKAFHLLDVDLTKVLNTFKFDGDDQDKALFEEIILHFQWNGSERCQQNVEKCFHEIITNGAGAHCPIEIFVNERLSTSPFRAILQSNPGLNRSVKKALSLCLENLRFHRNFQNCIKRQLEPEIHDPIGWLSLWNVSAMSPFYVAGFTENQRIISALVPLIKDCESFGSNSTKMTPLHLASGKGGM